jgi:rod shape-determining protein MreD
MNVVVKIGLRFLFFLFAQVLVLNQIEIGFGIQLMIYPLFILLLPVEMGVVTLMVAAFVLGILIDALSNTYGLHASSLLIVAYIRPMIFKLFAPRDGYDALVETNIFTMGTAWFLKVFGILIVVHHLWFFMLEMFKMNEIVFVLQKTFLSAPISFLICILLQYLFIQKRVEK